MNSINKKMTAVALNVFLISVATAQTTNVKVPSTPNTNPKLPIINIKQGSDHLKANMLNPFPVCNANEDRRTVAYKIIDHWIPVGTVSMNNQTADPIQLKQVTSKQQTISVSVNGEQSSSVDANIGGDGSVSKKGASAGVNWGIAMSMAKSFGGDASYSLSWKVGQEIGPYTVPAGYTGDATYGFRAVYILGTQQMCKTNGTWATPSPWMAFVPVKNEVCVKLYNDLADSAKPCNGSSKLNVAPIFVPDFPITSQPTQPQKLDLAPSLTVSNAKVAGYAGSVALRIKNVGTERYFGEFPMISFLVKVHTQEGPKGVDRIIKPHWFNGAYVADLGFDREKSVRTFHVTLSNPIELGDETLVASFNFFDGNTKLGRLKNYIEVSQVGRLVDDETYYNDIKVDSRKATVTDSGRPNPGLF